MKSFIWRSWNGIFFALQVTGNKSVSVLAFCLTSFGLFIILGHQRHLLPESSCQILQPFLQLQGLDLLLTEEVKCAF